MYKIRSAHRLSFFKSFPLFFNTKTAKKGKNEFQKNSKSNLLLVNIQVLLFFFFENDLFVLLLNQHLSSILSQRSLNGAHCMSISIIFNNAAKKKVKNKQIMKRFLLLFFLNGGGPSNMLVYFFVFVFLFLVVCALVWI